MAGLKRPALRTRAIPREITPELSAECSPAVTGTVDLEVIPLDAETLTQNLGAAQPFRPVCYDLSQGSQPQSHGSFENFRSWTAHLRRGGRSRHRPISALEHAVRAVCGCP